MEPINAIAILLLSCTLIQITNTFNISPQPNYVLREPISTTGPVPVRSSYFGYSINLRTGGR